MAILSKIPLGGGGGISGDITYASPASTDNYVINNYSGEPVYFYTSAATTTTFSYPQATPAKPKTSLDWLTEEVEKTCKLARAV